MPLTDPLDDALADLRISGSVLMHESYASPWAISIPAEARLRELLGIDKGCRVLLFHFVRRGGFNILIDGCDPMAIGTSDVAICSTGVAHTMSSGPSTHTISIEAILRREEHTRSPDSDSEVTELVCGVFLVQASPLNPMLSAVPAVMKVSTSDASFSPMLASVASMLAHELDRGALGSFASTRLLEMFFAEAIRSYQHTGGSERVGWFKGLADARVSQALQRVHASPAEDWTVQSLAKAAALSPSRFAARFRTLTGQSVMSYVARWRMNIACQLLRDTQLGLVEVADRVGYNSLPAFSRAFKAQVGEPPAAWRARLPKPGRKSALTQTTQARRRPG